MSSFWIATAYIQYPEQPEKFVALAAFVNTREEFEQRVQIAFKPANIRYRYQLAAIPAEQFFQRHGRIWLLHHATSIPEKDIGVILLNDEEPEPIIPPNTNYLNCHIVQPVKPLDMQIGRYPELFAPENLLNLLWKDLEILPNVFARQPQPKHEFVQPELDLQVLQRHKAQYGEPLPALKVYFLLDAKRVQFFNPKEIKSRIKSLFQGEFGEKAEKIAPYLIEVIPDYNRTHSGTPAGLFSLKSALLPFNWEDKLGIFIQSYADFDTVYQHLRRFPMVKDEKGKWFFFRFYDPEVLRQYLSIISHYPAKLHKFFGYDKSLIYSFGSGIGDNFHYYTLKALPEETTPTAITMSKLEKSGFKQQKWENLKSQYLDEIWRNYNDGFSEQDKAILSDYLDEAIEKNYELPKSIIYYALTKFYGNRMNINLDPLMTELNQQHYNQDETISILFQKLKKES